jgi:hypothetical protein
MSNSTELARGHITRAHKITVVLPTIRQGDEHPGAINDRTCTDPEYRKLS